MPPLEFDYSEPVIGQQVLTLDPGSQEGLPEGLDGRTYRWADLDGEGLPGVLSESGGAWYYKRNRSAGNLIPLPRRDLGRAGTARPGGDRGGAPLAQLTCPASG